MVSRLAVLADPMRLRMLRALERHELAVGEVAATVQLPQSTVSRHLKALADAGWVFKRQESTATLYRLVADDLPEDLRAIWVPVRSAFVASNEAEVQSDQRRVEQVLAERRTDSRTFFGRVAGEWQHHRSTLFGHGFTGPAMLSMLQPRWTVADLGCGSGDAARLLAPVVESVVAVDQSEAMLDAARRHLDEHRNIDFRCGDLEQMPVDDGSVDAAVLSLVLHHAASPGAVLAEARRILRRDLGGGVLVVIDMQAHDRDEYRRTMGHVHLGFTHEAMTSSLQRAGFERVRTRTLPTSSKTKGPGLMVASGWIDH